jgi:hypothetical protein
MLVIRQAGSVFVVDKAESPTELIEIIDHE